MAGPERSPRFIISSMVIRDLLAWAKKELKQAEVAEPESSAEFLLREVLSLDRAALYANLDKVITASEERKYKKFIARRKKHEPVWQITSEVEFFGRPFYVNRNVLVPRPETEFLVELALKEIKGKFKKPNSKLKILDIGTGSGAIIITLANEMKSGDFFGSDISAKALAVAKKNAKKNAAEVNFKRGDLFKPWAGEKFDLIVANLPYIPEEDMGGLAMDVHHYEPRLALSGGVGGLVIYDKFLQELPSYLKEDGVIFCEITREQGELFCNLANKYLPDKKCEIHKDLADIDRIAIIK